MTRNQKSILRNILHSVSGLIVGVALTLILAHQSYLDGRLSACTDITSVINRAAPILNLSCSVSKGEVVVETLLAPGKKLKLNGEDAS